jgi:nucleoside-diphosphate-sugar epimerase
LLPAVNGTLNVLKACKRIDSVKQVIVTSSMAAVWAGSSAPPGDKWDESCWSNEDELRAKSIFYPLSKTAAEKRAYEFMLSEEPQFTLATVNPCFIFGPQLQSTLNTSTEVCLKYVNGAKTTIPNATQSVVDVRDVSRAHILVQQHNSTGRHICVESQPHALEVCNKLRELYPSLPIPTAEEKKEDEPMKVAIETDTTKLRSLGWNPIPWEQCVKDTIDCAIEKGFLSN